MIKPIFDRVVIKPLEQTEKMVGSLIISAQSEEEPTIGTILAVGNGMLADGKIVDMQVKVGDKVAYSKFAGSTFKIDGEEVVVLRQADILGIIE